MEGFKGHGIKKRTLGLEILSSPSSYAILCNLHALYETQEVIIYRTILLSRAAYAARSGELVNEMLTTLELPKGIRMSVRCSDTVPTSPLKYAAETGLAKALLALDKELG